MKETIFCSCGRIHIVDIEDNMITKRGQTVGCICGGCGSFVVIGADDLGGGHYSMYRNEINANHVKEVDIPEAIKKYDIGKLTLSRGIRIPMKNGEYANSHFGDIFAAYTRPDEWKIEQYSRENNCSYDEASKIMNYILNTEVDMDRYEREVSEEDREVIGRYYVKMLSK